MDDSPTPEGAGDLMKPTISNAFNAGPNASAESAAPQFSNEGLARAGADKPSAGRSGSTGNPRKSLAASLAPMQADLRETEFGWSLELSPITAIDALETLGLEGESSASWNCLVGIEQSSWQDGDAPMPIADIAKRLAIPVIEPIDADQLVLDPLSLRQLVSLCQPTRLLVTLVDGAIDARDAAAINKFVEGGKSPLLAELRAFAAIEVMGDRSVVLHVRDRELALRMVAENFRHYLAALRNRPARLFAAPDTWQLERLFDLTGLITVRPIETQAFSTFIDVGINTAKERFGQPADRSIIYDIPSNSWHDEP